MPRDSEDALHRQPNAQSHTGSSHLPPQRPDVEAGKTRRAAKDQDLRPGSDRAILAAEGGTARADAKGACADGASALVAEATAFANEAKTSASAATAFANEAKTSAGVATAFANEAKTSASAATAFASEAKASADVARAFANEAKASADVARAFANEAKAFALVAIAGAEEAFPRQNGALEGGGGVRKFVFRGLGLGFGEGCDFWIRIVGNPIWSRGHSKVGWPSERRPGDALPDRHRLCHGRHDHDHPLHRPPSAESQPNPPHLPARGNDLETHEARRNTPGPDLRTSRMPGVSGQGGTRLQRRPLPSWKGKMPSPWPPSPSLRSDFAFPG